MQARRLIYVFLIGGLLTSCGFDEPVVFRGVKSVRVMGITDGKLNLQVQALFYNPNNIGGKLKRVDLAVRMDDEVLANVVQKENFRINRESEFLVPFTAQVSMEQLKQGFLGNIMAILGRRKLNLHFVGDIKVSSYGISRKVPVDFESEVQF